MSNAIDPLEYTFEEPVKKEFLVFPKGTYQFRVLEVNELEESKQGNPMIPIKVELTDDAGQTTTCYDNLVFIQSAKWKVDSFLKALAGNMAPGRKINFGDPDFVKWLKARTGQCEVDTEPVKGKEYLRNVIKNYVYESTKLEGTTVTTPAAKSTPPSTPAAKAEDDFDDDIPF